MKKKKMRIINFIFSIAFLAIIFVPLCMFDTTEIIDSELENRRMTMWPGFYFMNQEMNEWYGHYVEDRVGFREEAVRFYIDTTYALFGEFSTDMHMFGKEGEIFPADDMYVKAYQNLATDERLIDDFVTYLDRTDAYLDEKGISFVFLAGLDKKTVYGEFMPDYIHVDESRESVMGMLARKLGDAQVDYVIPVEEFAADRKEHEVSDPDYRLYNARFDATHWNAFGMMKGLKLLNEKIREQNPDVPILSEEHFDLSYQKVNIEFISLPLKDTVPEYTLKPEYAGKVRNDEEFGARVEHMNGTSCAHYTNEDALSDETILILHDSFLEGKQQFFTYRYKDVYMLSRQNYERMQYLVETLNPDVVVFENAERAFVDDLYAYVNLANIEYK